MHLTLSTLHILFIHFLHMTTLCCRYCCHSIFTAGELIHRDVKHNMLRDSDVKSPSKDSNPHTVCALDNSTIRPLHSSSKS